MTDDRVMTRCGASISITASEVYANLK